MKTFALLRKGATPTFLEASFANIVLRLLNGLIRAQVKPAGAGRFLVSENEVLLDLSPLASAAQAQAIADLQTAVSALQGQVGAISAALAAATITASCDPSSSTITIVLTIPNLP